MLLKLSVKPLMATTIIVAVLQTALCRCDPLTDALNSLTSGLTSGVTSGLTNGVLGGLRDTLGMLLGGVVPLSRPASVAAASAPPPSTIATPPQPTSPVAAPATAPAAVPAMPPMPPQMGYMMSPYGLLHQYQHQTQHQQQTNGPFAWLGRNGQSRRVVTPARPWVQVLTPPGAADVGLVSTTESTKEESAKTVSTDASTQEGLDSSKTYEQLMMV